MSLQDYTTSRGVEGTIKRYWPYCYLLPTDTKFFLPDIEEVMEVVSKTRVNLIKVIPAIGECDDLAIIQLGEVKKARIKQARENEIPASEHFSWPFGICFGTEFKGWSAPHWQNIVRTKEGLFLIEPQHKDYWKPNRRTDRVLFALI